MRAGVASIPLAAKRAKVSALGCAISTPRIASGSTTMVAPPAVVVSTATVRRPRTGGRIGVRRTSGIASSRPSRLSTRAMPQSARNALATSSSPASAPVCVTASSRAAEERPSL